MLRVPLAWYTLRLQRGLYLALPQENKAVRAVPMDDWHLTNFVRAVTKSRRSVGGANREPDNSHLADKTCAWCGQRASFAYSVPQDWENILPKLRPGIGRVFFACSDLHAEMIASKIFKDAFDYVTLSPPT